MLLTHDSAVKVNDGKEEKLGASPIMTVTRESRIVDNEYYYSYVLACGSAEYTKGEWLLSNSYANSDIILQETIYHPSSFGINRLGAPCMKEMVLSSLTGYVKCQNASVELNCFESERAVVENYMNSGFYIE